MRPHTVYVENCNTDGWVRLVTPYDAAFVEAFKSEVPHGDRQWSPDERSWKVRDNWKGDLLELCRQYFAKAEDRTAAQLAPGPDVLQVPQHYRELCLLPSAPQELVKQAYRIFVRLYHPDHGGTHEEMVTLNRAYQAICEERGW